MSTVQTQILRLAGRIDPTTKKGQKFQDVNSAVSITNATNASPIVITAANHGFVTGNQVYITGITGNTAANNTASNPNWTVTYVNANSFSLDGSTGNGAYSAGGTATGALVGSVDGGKFTRQRILDIYNEGRKVLFNAIYINRKNELNELVYSTISTANITWTYSSPNTTAPKPTGYMKLISLMSPTAGVPVVVMSSDLLQEVQLGTNPNLTQSASNMIGFEMGTTFTVPAYDCHGTGTITYYGMSDFALSDVTGGSTTETFSLDLEPTLIEIACAIANEQSNASAMDLARTLLHREK